MRWKYDTSFPIHLIQSCNNTDANYTLNKATYGIIKHYYNNDITVYYIVTLRCLFGLLWTCVPLAIYSFFIYFTCFTVKTKLLLQLYLISESYYAISIAFSVILTCDVHVCLTWEAEKGNITFKCKVSALRFEVHFLNPANDDLGFCVSPVPVPGCYSRDNVISQDLETNTSVLVIQRHIDNRLNGPWKCRHGTNVDAAIVNVTVIHQGNIPVRSVRSRRMGNICIHYF